MINVYSYEPMGTFGRPGLQPVVSLQGCNLRCLYCANPGTIETKEGTLTHLDEIVRMAVSQRAFFGKKGGITFSGGEPTFQAKALIPFLRRPKEAGVHICLDTNGGLWSNDAEEPLGLIDLVLLDIKEFSPKHRQSLIGRGNEQTLKTAAWLEANQGPFWLRYVLVPSYNDFEDDIRQLGEHLGTYRMIQRVEILLYHTLGAHEHGAMDKEYLLRGMKEDILEQIKKAEKLFRQYFRTVQVN